jgi:prepilin-type N-terminal cleavage/methylation domain-containing protein
MKKKRAFTLLEVMLSMVITGIIMAAMVSAMRVCGDGLTDGTVVATTASQTDRAIQMITQDLASATSITQSTATSVTMVVPPRNGDTTSETICYSWGGTAGNSLTRTYNGGAAATVVPNVYQFQLTYLRKTLTPGT